LPVVLLAAVVAAAPAKIARADRPEPRGDANSKIAHRELLEKAKRGGIDLYFVGDSIARRWGALDYPELLANWRENFYGWNAGNFAWGGDRIENMLWRIEHGELDGVNPRVIVILAGTNNLWPKSGEDAAVRNVTRGLDALVRACRRKAPAAAIIVTAIFPRNDHMDVLPEIARINDHIARMADGNRLRVLNINDRLADAGGRLFEGMLHDGLHPSLTGYQVWADALKPMLTELLGPPAAADHAPPPTGDPSKRKGRLERRLQPGEATSRTSGRRSIR
jgi:lysophospholipase L1-like esterase